MRCLVTCLHLSGTYDQFNSPCLASIEYVARRIVQIVEAYSGEGGKSRWAGVHHYEGERVPWTVSIRICELPTQRKPAGSWTLKTSAVNWATGAGRQGGTATGDGDDADGEGTSAAKDGGLETWRQRRNDCEPGQCRRDDRWPNQLPER